MEDKLVSTFKLTKDVAECGIQEFVKNIYKLPLLKRNLLVLNVDTTFLLYFCKLLPIYLC